MDPAVEPAKDREEEKEFRPMVVFQRIGGSVGHASMPSDNSHNLQMIREADAATTRAQKKVYKPLHSSGEKSATKRYARKKKEGKQHGQTSEA